MDAVATPPVSEFYTQQLLFIHIALYAREQKARQVLLKNEAPCLE